MNDDAAAIQAAYNYACSNGGGALYFPPGKYLVNSPLLFNCTTAQIEASGAGELVSTLDAGGRTGPVIVVSPTASIIAASGPLTASSLLSGGGVALNWTANSTIVWNIKEWMVAGGSGDKANPLNGLANFTWENWANLSSSATNGNVYCVTQSHAYVSYNATTALRICATANGALSGSLNVGGTVTTVSGGTFTKGATHAIAFVLDSAGATDNHCTAGNPCLRLYLDGTEVNNAQVSGTIQQAADEDWGLGTGDPFDGQWPESWASGSTNGWYGTIDSVRVSKTARYTASSYTPSSSKLGSDGNTVLLINGDLPAAGANIATTGIIEADSKTSGNAAQWAYVRSTAWPVTSALQKVHDLSISAQSGEPLYVDATPGFQAFNMRLTGGYKGVNCRNNTFESRFENLTVTMGNYSESGLSMSCGEIVNLDNIQVYNGVYNVVLSEGNYDVRNLFLTPIATTLIDLYESASSIFSQFTHSEVNSDSENGGPTQANLWIDDVQPGEHTFTGGNLQSLAATNVPPVWLNNQAASSVLFNNVNFSTAGGSTGPVVHFLGAPLSGEQVTAINPRLNGNPYSMTQQPLVDTAYASFATVLGHHLVIGGAPTLNGGMNNVAVNIVTDPAAPTISVHGATGSTSYGPYYVVCHDANGGATNPSSASNTVANGPSSLSASNYIQVSLGTLPTGCATYDVLRVTTATALVTGVANTGGSQTYNDIGQSTAAYTPPARNTTGDITFGTMAVSTGVAWPLPATVVNGASFYCPNCDPPANPPAACTSSGARTGSMVSGIHSQWICHY